jgi:hypothetical protein
MAPRKGTPDYSGLLLTGAAPAAPPAAAPPSAPAGAATVGADQPDAPSRPARKPRMMDVAQSVPVYLHPDGHRALKVYCAMEGVKPHDVMIEALEREFARRGIRAPVSVRADTPRPAAATATADPRQLDLEDCPPLRAAATPPAGRKPRRAAKA